MKDLLQKELEFRASEGRHPVTVGAIANRLAGLGYALDRDLDCRGLSRYMTGEQAGRSFPVITTEVKEIDSGISFANVDARRDENFRELQRLRREESLFAVVRGAILEI